MKKHSFTTPFTASLFRLAPIFWCLNLTAQITTNPASPIATHHHDEAADHQTCQLDVDAKSKIDLNNAPAFVKFEEPQSTAPSAAVQLSYLPTDATGAIIYENVAGWTGGAATKAQISIVNYVKNLGTATLNLRRIDYSYVQNGTTKNKVFLFDTGYIVINAGQTKGWQNSRKYHEVGNVLYLNQPIPTSITIKYYFVGESAPTTITKNLVPNTVEFGMPFRAFDLEPNEVWQGGSTHGGGGQVFAYDMSVEGLENGNWSYYLSGTNGDQNDEHRVWGKPVYAMADGYVFDFANDVINNPWPDSQATGGGGNFFKLVHGNYEALYAHFQMGSLNPALMQAGAVVKKGDFLGLAGNSGSSSGPHLHVHVVQFVNGNGYGISVPLRFNEGWVIQKSSFTTLSSTANWFKLNGHCLPGYATDRPFIWPSKAKPNYSDLVYTGVWRAGTDAHAFYTGMASGAFQTQDNTLKNQGYRLKDINVLKNGTSITYSGIWRAGTGASTLQVGASWANFQSQWSSLSAAGQRLLDIEVFKDANGNLKYAGVYGEGSWGHYLYIGKTLAEFNALWSSLGADGYRLVDVEVYNYNGSTYYAGIWKGGGSGPYALWHAGTWASFTNEWSNLSNDDFRLVDMDTDGTGANTIYSGTFLPGTDGYALWQHNWNSFISKWEHYSERGLRMIDINIRPASGNTLDDDSDDRASAGEIFEDQLLVGPTQNRAAKIAAADFNVFPNPVSDVFSVESEEEMLGWSLANSLGQVVRSGVGEAKTVGVYDLNPGIYQLSVRTGKGTQAKQIEVVR